MLLANLVSARYGRPNEGETQPQTRAPKGWLSRFLSKIFRTQ